MQRPANKQSPAATAKAKALMLWIKERGICAACGLNCGYGCVICHHFTGSSKKVYVGLERVMIGHFAVNGLCQNCDDIVTHGTRKEFRQIYGNESDVWLKQIADYPGEIPENVIEGIRLYGK